MTRSALKTAFLREAGWTKAEVAPLAGDASNRRYDRVKCGRHHAVLMDAPAERGEDIGLFLDMTILLRNLGLSAPEILHEDRKTGFALLEDLGDDLYARVAAARPTIEQSIYEAAVDLLAEMHASPPPRAANGRQIAPYDGAVLTREAALVPEWWAGPDWSVDQTAEYTALVDAACAPYANRREALVLRDYHAENLLWLPDRHGKARVGQLDYQDALIGSRAYDLMSLLEDARRDTPGALQKGLRARYCAATGVAHDVFHAEYSTLGAQRNLKILGIFARLSVRDGKPGYLDLTPRVWGHLMCDLSHPCLADLAQFVQKNLMPPDHKTLTTIRERVLA